MPTMKLRSVPYGTTLTAFGDQFVALDYIGGGVLAIRKETWKNADIVQGNKLIPERREGCPIRHAPQFHCFHFVISSHFSCLLPSADTMPGHREGSARLCLPCSPGAGRGRYIYATTAPCPRLPL